jgi:hypothetical protein
MPMKHGTDYDASNCHHGQQQKHKYQNHYQPPFSKQYNVNPKYDNITPEARKASKLVIFVIEQRCIEPIRQY